MKKFQLFYSILEKIFFVLAAIIVITFASGYKYDSNKQQIVQTGALTINNIEDNTTIKLNNSSYENKNDLAISYLDPKSYTLDIQKKGLLPYSTQINILGGQVKFINPVLIPTYIKSQIVQENILAVSYTVDSTFYIFKDINNNINLERLTTNKTFFGLDIINNIIDITKEFKQPTNFKINPLANKDFIIISNDTNQLIIDFNKLVYKDITALKVQSDISPLLYNNNTLLYTSDQFLYSLSLSDINNLLPKKIDSIKNSIYTLDENNNIFIISKTSNNQLSLSQYDTNGNIVTKNVIENTLELNADTKFFYHNKDLYIFENKILYKLNSLKLVQFGDSIDYVKEINKDTLLTMNSKTATIYNKDNIYNYNLSKNINIKSIEILPDYFTYFYLDKDNKLHLGDFGGQDNIIEDMIDKGFMFTLNNSSINLYYDNTSQIKLVKFGNNK